MHSATVRRIAVMLLVACAAASLGLLTACGSGEPQLPQVTTSVTIGPGPHEATVNVSSSGDGYGVAQLVLTYPDGSRHVTGQGVLESDLSLGFSPGDLQPGDYEYTVYAVATSTPPPSPDFPSGADTEKNAISSGTFTLD
jgi:hypothetical protein